MKRMILTLVAAWMMIASMNAQRLTDIQAEARFITDKMVVELGLSSVQRNSILNINLNYLNSISSMCYILHQIQKNMQIEKFNRIMIKSRNIK